MVATISYSGRCPSNLRHNNLILRLVHTISTMPPRRIDPSIAAIYFSYRLHPFKLYELSFAQSCKLEMCLHQGLCCCFTTRLQSSLQVWQRSSRSRYYKLISITDCSSKQSGRSLPCLLSLSVATSARFPPSSKLASPARIALPK